MSYLAMQILCAHCGHRFEPDVLGEIEPGAPGRPDAPTVAVYIDPAEHVCKCSECGIPYVPVEKDFGRGREVHWLCRNRECPEGQSISA